MMLLTGMLHSANHSSATASERPPHKETQAYGCCVSTLTRFVRPPLQRPLTGSRASIRFSVVRPAARAVKGCPECTPLAPREDFRTRVESRVSLLLVPSTADTPQLNGRSFVCMSVQK